MPSARELAKVDQEITFVMLLYNRRAHTLLRAARTNGRRDVEATAELYKEFLDQEWFDRETLAAIAAAALMQKARGERDG